MNIKSMIKEIETEIQKKDWEIIRMRSAINELKKIGEIQETHPNQYSENKKKDKHKLKERGMISWNDEIKEFCENNIDDCENNEELFSKFEKKFNIKTNLANFLNFLYRKNIKKKYKEKIEDTIEQGGADEVIPKQIPIKKEKFNSRKNETKNKLSEKAQDIIVDNFDNMTNNELREKIYDEEGIFYNVYKIEDFMDDNSLIREEEDE